MLLRMLDLTSRYWKIQSGMLPTIVATKWKVTISHPFIHYKHTGQIETESMVHTNWSPVRSIVVIHTRICDLRKVDPLLIATSWKNPINVPTACSTLLDIKHEKKCHIKKKYRKSEQNEIEKNMTVHDDLKCQFYAPLAFDTSRKSLEAACTVGISYKTKNLNTK